ncbi:rhamnosyltransferase [Cedecea lapagei]|uniref:Rhamnosyltransferase n=1 Tax=Cedecea lapagei TaxID=158823 RepID=A0A447V0G1_9ENTR|nr:glycosyltransferase [Cedecea lapagei]VEB96365.1 rhamnosyltransferase [Cedecea lapagei]
MKIMPVVVLYKKQISESESINSILDSDDKDEIKDFFVYNNSPSEYTVPNKYNGANIHVVNDYKNSGVSKAYNEGLSYARKLGYTHVLLLDQDTTFPKHSIDVYKNALAKSPFINLFSPILKTKNEKICSPLRYKCHRGFTVDDFKPGEYSLEHYSPINSGMLINVEAAVNCGGYNEDVYLDFSDFQFIERFKRYNEKFIVVDLVLLQDFSGEETNVSKLLTRFNIYCECAKRCERNGFNDDFIYFMMVFARALKLVVKTRKLTFIKCFYKKYVRG